MRRALIFVPLFVACAAIAATLSDDLLVSTGKQRADAMPIKWDVRDGTHQKLGAVRTAMALDARRTDIGRDRIISSIYFSCEKDTGKIAIELANALESAPQGGLRPKEMPRLTCFGLPRDATVARSVIATNWEANNLGDVLSRDIPLAAMRGCVSIDIFQNVALPAGAPRESQEVGIEIATYSRDLDAVFSACGAATAYATPAEKPRVVEKPRVAPTPPAPPVEKPRLAQAAPAPKPAAAPPATTAADADWQRARTISKGNTNVRAAGNLDAPIVKAVPPGYPILVQRGAGDWWAVKPRSGDAFQGFVRRDRFVLE